MDNHPFFIMGLFDETRTYIASTTQSLIQDTPDYIRQSILNSILANRELVPDILDATLNSFAVKDIRPMFEYARDVYTNGLPEGSKGWVPASFSTLETVLAKEYPSFTNSGKTFRVVAASLGGPSPMHIGIETFVKDPRFDSWTLFNEPDFNNPDALVWRGYYNYSDGDYWGTGFKLDDFGIATEYSPIRIAGSRWRGIQSFYYYWEYHSYHEPLIKTGTYYTVEYEIINPDGTTYKDKYWPKGIRYWSYYPASNRYPELSLDSTGGSVPSGTFYFPVIPLRVYDTQLNNKNTALYKTSKKLLKFMELDIDDIHTGILNNPDVSAVDHVYIVFGIDVHTKTDAGVNYIYEYFSNEYARQTVTESMYNYWLYDAAQQAYSHPPVNNVEITDGTYKVNLIFSYISIKEYNGVIGQVGKTTKTITVVRKEPLISRPPGALKMYYEDERNTLKIRKQVTPTRYREITVAGLCLANTIGGTGKAYWTNLWGSINLTGGEQQNTPLVIPLNVAIAQSLPLRDANTLYYESIKIVFNAFEVVKLKWYETSFFRFVSQILVLAVSVVTGGLANLVNSITVAISAGLTATALLISKMIIVSALASATFKFAVEEAGLDVGYVFAGLALAYGVSGSLLDLPLADTFLSIGTNLNEAVTSLTQEAITEVTTELTDLEEEYQTKLESLEDLLKPTEKVLDPLSLFTNVGMLPNESPTDYFNRTIELKNPGILSIESVSNFVNTKLDLNLI